MGFLIASSRIRLDLTRLNPITGLFRFLNLRVLVDLAKNLAKLGMVGWVAWHTLATEWENLPFLANIDLMAAMSYVVGICLRLFWRCLPGHGHPGALGLVLPEEGLR